MEHDDWIKFGHALWAAHHGEAKESILQHYRKSWSTIYESAPMLGDNGGPLDFLFDPRYSCSKPVPWRPHVETRFSAPLHQATSTSTERPASQSPPPPISVDNNNNNNHDSDPEDLDRVLGNIQHDSFNFVYNTNFPRIKDGLFPGLRQHSDPQTPPTRLQVVFPIVPHYILHIQEDKPNGAVSIVELDKKDFLEITSQEKNCMYLAKDQSNCAAGKSRYYCTSWLILGIEMMEHNDKWDIRFLGWKAFANAVVNQSGPVWDLVLGAKLLIGGVNFSASFLDRSYELYDLSYGEMGQLWTGMSVLSQTLTIWPHPRDLLMTGSKLFLNRLITSSATSKGLSHLQIVPVDELMQVVKDIANKKISAVLKRDYSCAGRHVFSVHTPDPFKRLESLLDEESNAYSDDLLRHFPRPVWFIQPFNPGLTYFGEIRVYLVNGILFAKIVTTPRIGDDPNNLDLIVPILLTPLSRLSLDPVHKSQFAAETLSPLDEDLENTLPQFVLNMLHRLVIAEEHITKRRSCMRIFVRMDVAVYKKDNKFHYAINELTRSHHAGLFWHWIGIPMDYCIQELEKVLHFVAYNEDVERRLLLGQKNRV